MIVNVNTPFNATEADLNELSENLAATNKDATEIANNFDGTNFDSYSVTTKCICIEDDSKMISIMSFGFYNFSTI